MTTVLEGNRHPPDPRDADRGRAPSTPGGPGGVRQRVDVLSQRFEAGHLLGLRSYPIVPGTEPVTWIWYGGLDGRWVGFRDGEPDRMDQELWGPLVERIETSELTVARPASRELNVVAPASGLGWSVRLGVPFRFKVLNGCLGALPAPVSELGVVRWTVAAMLRWALGLRGLSLAGWSPGGLYLELSPRRLARIVGSAAVVGGRDLGAAAPLRSPMRLGSLSLPTPGLFARLDVSVRRGHA